MEVQPTRLAFCEDWRSGGELEAGLFEIIGEFDTITADRFPVMVDSSTPLFAAVFWEGFAIDEAPQMQITTPSKENVLVCLPRLNPYRFSQVQVNSLIGFSFNTAGEYLISVGIGPRRIEKLLSLAYDRACCAGVSTSMQRSSTGPEE